MKAHHNNQKRKTPIKSALVPQSMISPLIKKGLTAVLKKDLKLIEETVRTEFVESLNLDQAMQKGHEKENRWDYLLGYGPSNIIIAVEPHSANTREMTTVVQKREMAKIQLRPHLQPNAKISIWIWIASGKVHFADTEKMRRILDQKGILFVAPTILRKHLHLFG